jgi:single-strand DNA-binding protein
MNNVVLIGRLTKDPEVRYIPESQTAVCTFTLAVDRPGKDKGADFPRITVFGKQAENCERYLEKGRLCGIQGRIQTGSYKNKDGVTVYTTDVIAERVEFLEWGDKQREFRPEDENQTPESMGFQALEDDDDIPF